MTWGLIAVIATLWGLQMLLAYRQSRAFLAEMRRLRSRGTVAVGVNTESRMRRRHYIAIAVDSSGRVVEAVELAGLSVAARPRALRDHDGDHIDVLAASTRDDRRSLALRRAATTLRDHRGAQKHDNDDGSVRSAPVQPIA